MAGQAGAAAHRAGNAVRTLDPGYFAVVMATGIVSIGLFDHGLRTLSAALLGVAAVCYAGVLVLHGWRLAAFRAELGTDLADPQRGFGFFTFVAGTDVLGPGCSSTATTPPQRCSWASRWSAG